MLLDIITHAGTLGEEDDQTVNVRAFHNLDSRFDVYTHGHRLREVFADTAVDADAFNICDAVWTLLNVGEDPAFGAPDPRALDYRRRGHRSLSTGDVIAVGEDFYAVAEHGFTRITDHPVILSQDEVADLEYQRRTADGVHVIVNAQADTWTDERWTLKVPRRLWDGPDSQAVWEWVETHFDRHAEFLDEEHGDETNRRLRPELGLELIEPPTPKTERTPRQVAERDAGLCEAIWSSVESLGEHLDPDQWHLLGQAIRHSTVPEALADVVTAVLRRIGGDTDPDDLLKPPPSREESPAEHDSSS